MTATDRALVRLASAVAVRQLLDQGWVVVRCATSWCRWYDVWVPAMESASGSRDHYCLTCGYRCEVQR